MNRARIRISFGASRALDAFIDIPGRKVVVCEVDGEQLHGLNIALAVAGAAVDAAARQRGMQLTRPNVNITYEEVNP